MSAESADRVARRVFWGPSPQAPGRRASPPDPHPSVPVLLNPGPYLSVPVLLNWSIRWGLCACGECELWRSWLYGVWVVLISVGCTAWCGSGWWGWLVGLTRLMRL